MRDHTAVARLVDTLGATVAISMREPYGNVVMVLDLSAPGEELSRQARKLRDSAVRGAGVDPDEGVVHLDTRPGRGFAGLDKVWRNLGVGSVLLLGAQACHEWRTDVQLTRVMGAMYAWRSRVRVYPMMHMNAVLRGTITHSEWKRQVSHFFECVDDVTSLTIGKSVCVACGERMFMLDADALPWCADHYATHLKKSYKPATAGGVQGALEMGT